MFPADPSGLAMYECRQAIKDAQRVVLAIGDDDHGAFHDVKISKRNARRLLAESPHWSVSHRTASRVVEMRAIRAEANAERPQYLRTGA